MTSNDCVLITFICVCFIIGGYDATRVEGVHRSTSLALAFSWTGAGRGGEGGSLNYTGCKVIFANTREEQSVGSYLDMLWPQKKIGAPKPIAITSDCTDSNLCPIDALARYYVVKGGSSKRATGDNRVFPHAPLKSSHATCVSMYLRDIVNPDNVKFGKLKELHGDVHRRMDNTQLNATAIRRGGIQQLKRTDSI
jgi:hypothetical protein